MKNSKPGSAAGSTTILSFIISSFQQGWSIRRCLSNIAMQGLLKDRFEALVFEGGSSEETCSILDSHPLKPRRDFEPNCGKESAINKGLSQEQGEIMAWINSDDFYYAGVLNLIQKYSGQRPNVDMVYGRVSHVGMNGQIIEPYPMGPWYYPRLVDYCFICQLLPSFEEKTCPITACSKEKGMLCSFENTLGKEQSELA